MRLHIECILKRMIFFAGLAIWLSLYTKGQIFTDEGAYLYHAMRVSVGDVPYKEFFDHHAPLALFFLGALFWLFEPSLQIAKMVMIGINLSIAYILYRICTRFTSEPMALLGALLFSLISPGFLGMKFILEPFVILFTAASLLMFYRFFETDQPQYLGLAGLMSGFAIMSKQNSALFFMIYFFLILFQKREDVNLKVRCKLSMFYVGGAALAILPTAVYLLAMDALNEAVHNILLYNLSHQMLFTKLPPTSLSRIAMLLLYGSISLCFAPLIGIGLIAQHLFDEQRFRLLVLWEGSMLIFVYPRFEHFHFIAAIAPAIVMVTIFLDRFLSELREAFSTKNQKRNITIRPARRRISVILVLVILYAGFYADISYLRLRSNLYRDENYEAYEAALNELAEYIQDMTLSTEKIFILGNRADIYFFSQREAAVGYSCIFPWDTKPEMQESIIEQLIKKRVRLIIFENGSVDGIHITEYAWMIYNFIILNYHIIRTFPYEISVFQQNRLTQMKKNTMNAS